MKTASERRKNTLFVESLDDAGRRASWGQAFLTTVQLNGASVDALRIGGIGTAPEHRRQGLVRECLKQIFDFAGETGCLMSVLHPFSSSYYRKFGFERVSDHRILEFPMKALDFVPFFRDMIPCEDIALRKDLSFIHNEFIKTRNISSPRPDHYSYPMDHKEKKTYIWYDDQKRPAAYIIYGVENFFSVNHMESVNLNVYEMCYLNPEGLMRLLGFIRMFEGELETVKIHNCAMAPEVELMLRHYMHTRITLVSDVMARVHDVGGVLAAVKYPALPGRFTVRVREPEKTSHNPEKTDGVWQVEYEAGQAQVTRLGAQADCDIACDVPAFTQLVAGFQSFGAETARYMHNVELNNSCEDFFRAFPNRPCGVFEHF